MNQPLDDHENRIQEAFSGKEAPVNIDQLWNNLESHVPPAKKRRNFLLPIFMISTLSLFAGIIFLTNKVNALESEKRDWLEMSQLLNKQLEDCSHKSMAMESQHQANSHMPNVIYKEEKHHHSSGLSQSSTKINEVNKTISTESLLMPKTEGVDQALSQEDIIVAQMDHLDYLPINNHLKSLEHKKDIELPIERIKPRSLSSKTPSKWQVSMHLMTGIHHAKYALDANEKLEITWPTAVASHAINIEVKKKLNEKSMIGLGLTHRQDVSALDYDYTEKKSIDVIDINEVFIDQQGNSTNTTGLLGATKITQKKGRIYDIDKRWTLDANFSYSIVKRNNSHLWLNCSIGIDLYADKPLSLFSKSSGLIKNQPYFLNHGMNYMIGMQWESPLYKKINYNIGISYLHQSNKMSLLSSTLLSNTNNFYARIGTTYRL